MFEKRKAAKAAAQALAQRNAELRQFTETLVAEDACLAGMEVVDDLKGAALLVLWRREPQPAAGGFRLRGHPWTTIVFVAAFWALAVNTVIRNPRSAGIGVLILLAGVPAYFFWRRRAA